MAHSARFRYIFSKMSFLAIYGLLPIRNWASVPSPLGSYAMTDQMAVVWRVFFRQEAGAPVERSSERRVLTAKASGLAKARA